jgi:subtilisin family serine protease
VDGRPDPYDDNGHGTYMASLLVARGRLAGVAPELSLIVGKVIRADGEGDDSQAAAGVDFCLEKEADVISLSLGGRPRPLQQTRTEAAASRAISLGVFVVASAGNDGPANKDVASPAALSGAIAVGAVDRAGDIAPFSSRGANSPADRPPLGRQDPDRKPETVAPGVGVPGAWLDGNYVTGEGTSQATAIVAGIVALVLGSHPELQRKDQAAVQFLKGKLMESGVRHPEQAVPHDDRYGYGRIDAVALEALL